ncbi:MAG: hypothetical protein IH897_03720, partial [Planctomycetes bacterium]|nr:hypothetical protein [Planctomycetota bacterium]
QMPDLTVANQGSGNVSVLLGVGDGTFAAAVNYAAGWRPILSGILMRSLDPRQCISDYDIFSTHT